MWNSFSTDGEVSTMSERTKCPECDEKYSSLGHHWRYSPSHRPDITRQQIEIITGSMMGDGSINKTGDSLRFQIGGIRKKYLHYLDRVFGLLSTGVKVQRTASELADENRKTGFSTTVNEENYNDMYYLRTYSHPSFAQFRDWYQTGEKVWPDDIDLSPTVLKHWYVQDGSFVSSGEKSYIKISMYNERDNRKKIDSYFSEMGLPTPSNYNDSDGRFAAQFTKNDSRKLFDYMGEEVPGFKYKWPQGGDV